MSKKTKEHISMVIKSITSETRPDVVKNLRISDLLNIQTAERTGYAVTLTLSTRYDYTGENLEDWRKQLEADDYIISVNCNRLLVRFNVMYGKK